MDIKLTDIVGNRDEAVKVMEVWMDFIVLIYPVNYIEVAPEDSKVIYVTDVKVQASDVYVKEVVSITTQTYVKIKSS